MRSFCLNTIIAVAGLLAGSALPSRAEVLTSIEIQVSFPFNVGNVTLPAGSYEILKLHETGAVIVRPIGGGYRSAAAIVSPFRDGTGYKADFVRVDGKYFLSSITLGDGRTLQVAAPHLK